LLSLTGSSAFFALYPVLVQEVFDIAPDLSSMTLALAVSVRLVLYAPAGYWSHRLGPRRLLRVALSMRCLAFLGVFHLGWTSSDSQTVFIFLGLTLAILMWALLSVSGTALTAHLSPIGKGEGLGLFNAATALAGILGAIVGGWMATQWGYNATSGLAVVGLGLGLLLTRFVRMEDFPAP
jgi:MFS family permease